LCRRILPVFIFGSQIIVFAGSGNQTDWSGGIAAWGPVIEWTDQFFIESHVNWDSMPGSIALPHQPIIARIIAADFDGATSVYSEDIDGDGDMDVLGAGNYSPLTWWENADGSGINWIEHIIGGYAVCVYSDDFDNDGDMDVLSAAELADEITWWENADGSGTSWIAHIISDDFDVALSVYSKDLDNDGDIDVLGAASSASGGVITWWENDDGLGTSWTEHVIDGDFDGANYVYSEDIDGDGNMDILGTATWEFITWWENPIDSGTLEWIELSVGTSVVLTVYTRRTWTVTEIWMFSVDTVLVLADLSDGGRTLIA